MNDIKLTDILDVSILQRLQDSFSMMVRTAILIVDEEGRAVTEASGFSDLCKNYLHTSDTWLPVCEACYKERMEKALKEGRPEIFTCHAGLTVYVAPIAMEGKVVGGLVGGQVFAKEPNPIDLNRYASELGISFETYLDAVKNINILSAEEFSRTAEFVYRMAVIASELAYSRHTVMTMVKEIEQAANMKADFLANMSHEIRTPMNAVIGMAEMALREDLTDDARNYVTQIKNSGRSLLNIINDILDFSKIESGKMDIIMDDYEPLSLFNDVANIINTRLVDKDVELILCLNPLLPRGLYGDSQRIRQVLINLANNAVKFTNKGRVHIDVDYEPLDEEHITLKISVKDTGIGIKEDDLKNLFQSFQQVDTKRNRNVEGTGLGLAISKRLVNLMGGTIGVESEYEHGSNFYFSVPQKITDWEPSLVVEDSENTAVIGYIRNKYIARQFYRDCKAMNVLAFALTDHIDFDDMIKMYGERLKNAKVHLFIEDELYTDEVKEILKNHNNIHCARLVEFGERIKPDSSNETILHKPYSTVVAQNIFGDSIRGSRFVDNGLEDFDFIAPDAEILIVDDNAINLTVAEGLLEPLKMKIMTAISGKMALEQISIRHFDLIFMDHMMPELDGVETTRIIRRLHPDYADVPIIALTANAVEGARDMFLNEGMNDMVAKPIEIRNLISTLSKWLPAEKIKKVSAAELEEQNNAEANQINLNIGDLDVSGAIAMLGSEKLFLKVLKDYYLSIDKKYEAIKNFEQAGSLAGYTIEVHALKSISKQIGAKELAERAAELEKAGNQQNISFIKQYNGEMLKKYLSYKEILAPLFAEKESVSVDKGSISKENIVQILDEMMEACDNLDMDGMAAANDKLIGYSYSETEKEILEKLSDAVSNIDVDTIEELVNRWKDCM